MGFCDHEYQELRRRIHIPFVIYDGYFENEGRICNIQLDDRDGGRQVGQYLLVAGNFQKDPQDMVLPSGVKTVLINNLEEFDVRDGILHMTPWQFVVLEV